MRRPSAGIISCLVAAFFWVSALDCGAQPASAPLTLTAAIEAALAHNPGLEAASSGVEAALQQIPQARSGLLPQVYFSETFNRTDNPMWAFGTKLNQEVITQNDFDPNRLNHPAAISNFATAVSLDWPLFEMPALLGLHQAKTQTEVERLALIRTRQKLIAQTAEAFSGLLLAQEELAVVDQSIETARANLRMVRSRYDSGFVVKSDLLRAQLRIAELQQDRFQAQSQVAEAKAGLNAVMGVAIDTPVQPVGAMNPAPQVIGDMHHWIQTALEQRPDLKQVRQQEVLARQAVEKARSAHLPSLHLVGNYEINSEDFTHSADNYAVGAVMRVNLFSGQRIMSRTRQRVAEQHQRQAMKREMELGVQVQTRQALLEVRSAWQRIDVAKAAIALADEGLRIVRNRYKNGLLTIVSLLDAEVALQRVRTSHFKALHDYTVARARLALASGTIDERFQ
jgi:outer membrane protein